MNYVRSQSWLLLCVLWACGDTAVLELFPTAKQCPRSTCASGTPTDAGPLDAGPLDAGPLDASQLDANTPEPACAPLAERITVRTPAIPVPSVPSNEYNPTLLAARPDDTSLLGYRESGAARVHVLALDESNKIQREIFQTPGEEAHALLAHSQGGALVLMREDPDIYSAEFCRGPDTPDKPICGSMELLRFDGDGQVSMAATLTDKTNVAEGDASFIYWFEHTARLVWAEDTYGVYFRSARNTPGGTPTLVSTDSLRFIDPSGNRLARGWTFGCAYSWSVRLAYNGTWAAACHGDFSPNAHRILIIEDNATRELTFLDGTAPVDRALGGLVAAGSNFWVNYLQRKGDGLELHLRRVSAAPLFENDLVLTAATHIDGDYVFRTYLARYGEDLLVGWKSEASLVLLVVDGETGVVLEGPVTTSAPIDNYVEFVTYPGGDVGWAHTANNGEISVTRVEACPN